MITISNFDCFFHLEFNFTLWSKIDPGSYLQRAVGYHHRSLFDPGDQTESLGTFSFQYVFPSPRPPHDHPQAFVDSLQWPARRDFDRAPRTQVWSRHRWNAPHTSRAPQLDLVHTKVHTEKEKDRVHIIKTLLHREREIDMTDMTDINTKRKFHYKQRNSQLFLTDCDLGAQ